MLLIDAHLDLAWNALQWDRDLLSSVYTLRTRESQVPGKGRAANTVALPELRQGRIALCFATMLARSTGIPVPQIDYATPAQAHAVARGQFAYYHALARQGALRIIGELADLDAHIAAWQAWEADGATAESPPVGVVLSFEGADPILQPDTLADWHALGLRLIGPAHYGPGRYAGGTGTERPLTPIGVELLAEMERLGIALDLTHLSDPAFWQALDRFGGAVFASHNNCRALVPHQRQFSDAQLRAIVERDGVIGAALDVWMLQPGWIHGDSNAGITLAAAVDQIDYVCQLAGNSRHAAIGSDLDGGFGREQSPTDLDTIADLQRIAGLLAVRGYSAEDIASICHGNWLALLRRAWSRRSTP